jgi:hypothetical protein
MDTREPPQKIKFDYIKTPQFRIIHADGAIVSVLPSGLTVTFFSERMPIPKRVVHEITAEGNLGPEIMAERDVRDTIIRDTEVVVSMSIERAKALSDVLNRYIGLYEEAVKNRTTAASEESPSK